MRRLFYAFFHIFSVIIFLLNPANAQDADPDIFKKAFTSYQEHRAAGNFKEAVEHARISYELGSILYGDDSKSSAALAHNYGEALYYSENFSLARDVLEKAQQLFEKNYGNDALELVDTLMMLAKANYSSENVKSQKQLFNRALRIVERHEGKDSLIFGEISFEVADGLYRTGDSSTGDHLKTAYDIIKEKRGIKYPLTGLVAFTLGQYELANNRIKNAEKHLIESLQGLSEPDGSTNRYELTAHMFLVEVYEKLNDDEKATFHCQIIGRMTPPDPDQSYLPVYKVQPVYPREALIKGETGYVVLEFTVNEEGKVIDPKVIESEGSEIFHKAAIDAAKKFRYAPRFIDGRPVATTGVQNKIIFLLGEGMTELRYSR